MEQLFNWTSQDKVATFPQLDSKFIFHKDTLLQTGCGAAAVEPCPWIMKPVKSAWFSWLLWLPSVLFTEGQLSEWRGWAIACSVKYTYKIFSNILDSDRQSAVKYMSVACSWQMIQQPWLKDFFPYKSLNIVG